MCFKQDRASLRPRDHLYQCRKHGCHGLGGGDLEKTGQSKVHLASRFKKIDTKVAQALKSHDGLVEPMVGERVDPFGASSCDMMLMVIIYLAA